PPLTVTTEAQSPPALRASGPRVAFTPALKGGALAKGVCGYGGRPQNASSPQVATCSPLKWSPSPPG
ncbi:hypothetical protein ACFW6F_33050, partial [Streptomyces sp. NPDC058746]|uniref:hypothetical protein n=1 Tax=Streptomyces sp. NPDC058746 TaxID=3346622 RepID=UPI0036ADB0BB